MNFFVDPIHGQQMKPLNEMKNGENNNNNQIMILFMDKHIWIFFGLLSRVVLWITGNLWICGNFQLYSLLFLFFMMSTN